MTTGIINRHKTNWLIEIKAKKPTEKQPYLINNLLNVKWQIKISLGTNFFDPPNCSNCRQPAKVVLRWYMLIDGTAESSDTFCYTCGRNNLISIQENPEKLGSIEIITPKWKEILEDIKENFEELNIEWKDKTI